MGDLINQTGTDTLYTLQDGQGSTRLTTDASGTTQDILTFDAFGNRADGFGRAATEQTTINHLYVGEFYDEEAGLYHLRARDYDSRTGRFTARDEFQGAKKIPLSTNPYLYGHADPINMIDPSGYMTIGALGISININLSTIATGVYNIIRIYESIDKAIMIMQVSAALLNAANFFDKEFPEMVKGAEGDKNFLNALSEFDSGISNLFSNSHRVIAGIKRYKSDAVKQFLSNPKNNLLLYGPTPYSKTTPWAGKRITIGSIKLSKSSRKIMLETGRASDQGGRLLGLGHTFGSGRRGGGHMQWFRQDWHASHGAHDYLSPPYHYHWKK